MSTVAADPAALVAEERRAFAERNPESGRLHEEARRFLPGGHTRTILAHEPFPLTFVRGEGAVLTDIHTTPDGPRYATRKDFVYGEDVTIGDWTISTDDLPLYQPIGR